MGDPGSNQDKGGKSAGELGVDTPEMAALRGLEFVLEKSGIESAVESVLDKTGIDSAMEKISPVQTALQNLAPPLGLPISVFAAKHGDPQVGCDIHMYTTPASPVTPVPLPTPIVSAVFDPIDLVPILGQPVRVNGVRAATAGTASWSWHVPIPPAIPASLPEPLSPPRRPKMSSEIFMGSQTVLAGGPFSRLGLRVLECNMAGILPPIRIRAKSFKAPVTVLPMGFNLSCVTNVFVGGPPTVDMFLLLLKGVLSGLKGLKNKWRPTPDANVKPKPVDKAPPPKEPVLPLTPESMAAIAKQADKAVAGANKVVDNAVAGVNKVTDNAKLPDNMKPDNLTCNTRAGEPVDIRDGTVIVDQRDFSLPGRLPLDWMRHYAARRIDDDGMCGRGWCTLADLRLELSADGSVRFRQTEGAALFDALPEAPGDEHAVLEAFDGARLSWQRRVPRDVLQVRTRNNVRYIFAHPGANGRTPGRHTLHLPIERIEDACGNYWRFERDNGRLIRIAESGIDGAAGREIRIHEENGHISQMLLFDPATQTSYRLADYGYDASGNLCSAADAMGAAYTFAYEQHRLTRHTNRIGQSIYYAYDAQWRVVHTWGDNDLYDYTLCYHDLLDEVEITDSRKGITRIRLNESRLPLCKTDALGGVTTYEYDEAGRTAIVTDPAGLRTEYDYDARGNLLKLTRPDGRTIQTAFDANDCPVAFTDPNGQTWQQQWDERGLLVAQTSPLGDCTQYTWDAHGQLATHRGPQGGQTRLIFDRHGSLASLTDAAGHTSQFVHDGRGCLLQGTDAMGGTSSYSYDAKGRLTLARRPGGGEVRVRYDTDDNPTEYTDENGAQTRMEWFGFNHLVRTLQPDGRSVRYLYDGEEDLIGVVNQNGETWQLKRDLLGRIAEEVDYWGQSTHYQYDASGHLQRRVDPLGQAIDYQTDRLGRILRKTLPHPDDPAQTLAEHFKYDHNGALTEMHNVHSRVKRKFDAAGRLLEEKQNGFCIRNTYDAAGNRIERTSSIGNRIVQTFDALSQLKSIQLNDDAPIVIERDALGRAVTEHLGSDLLRQSRYDSDGRLTAQAVLRDESALFSASYQYDSVGNLIGRRDSEHGFDAYHYDPMGRLLEHVDPTGHISRFVADAAGNRLPTRMRQTGPAGNARDPHRRPAPQAEGFREGECEGLRYVFDRAGNLVLREEAMAGSPAQEPHAALHLRWDANHRLIESHQDGQTTHYGYDAAGRRVFKRNTTHTTCFYWDGDALMGEVSHPNDAPDLPDPRLSESVGISAQVRHRRAFDALYTQAREYIYEPGGFRPQALLEKRADGTAAFHFHNDPNGCPTRMTDREGKVVWSASHQAWGGLRRLHVNEVENPIRFQGQYFDNETGLHYNRYRYYDPLSGDYINKDPIGLAGGIRVYGYGVNPVGWIDPLGLSHNTPKKTPKLSDPNPVPKKVREQYEEIHLGNGTPRIDPATGSQTIHQGRQQPQWRGALEWDVPGTNHRILERPDGRMGYVLDHNYRVIRFFPAPWYSDGGWPLKR